MNRTNKTGSADTADTSFILATGTLQGYGYFNDILATLTALEAKIGINASAVTTSIDYLLKNTASVDPGHKHSALWAPNATRAEIQTDNNGNGNVTLNTTRFQTAEGAEIASANNLTLGNDGNLFALSGTTTVNLIDITSWQAGSLVVLIPRGAGAITFAHQVAGSGNFKPLFLKSGANTSVGVNVPIGFIWETVGGGNSWYQIF